MSRTIAFSTIVVVLISTMALTSTGCRHCQNCHDEGGPVYMNGVPTVGHHGQRAGSIFSPAVAGPQGGMLVDAGPMVAQDGIVIGASASTASQPIQGFVGPPMGASGPLTFEQTPREGAIRILSDEVTVPATIPQTPAPATEGPEQISTPVPRPVTASTPVPSMAVPSTTAAPGEWSSVPETPALQPVEDEPVVAMESDAAPGLLR